VYVFLNSELVPFGRPSDIAVALRSEGERSLLTCTVMLAKSLCTNKPSHVYETIAGAKWDGGFFFFLLFIFPR